MNGGLCFLMWIWASRPGPLNMLIHERVNIPISALQSRTELSQLCLFTCDGTILRKLVMSADKEWLCC